MDAAPQCGIKLVPTGFPVIFIGCVPLIDTVGQQRGGKNDK